MTWRSRYFLFATYALVLIGVATDANACSCVSRISEAQKIDWATTIFVARVKSVRHVGSRLNQPDWPGVAATIEISEVIKGNLIPREVVTGEGGGDCGVPMRLAETYVFFVDAAGEVDICSGTRPYIESNEGHVIHLRQTKAIVEETAKGLLRDKSLGVCFGPAADLDYDVAYRP